MPRSTDSQALAPPRITRSRNGCLECRRLHRRCDEQRPACASCREAGKVCSYRRPLSWGGRPFGRSTFRHALGGGVVEIPIADSDEDASYRRSFVYGQAESSRSAATRAEARSSSLLTIAGVDPAQSSSSSGTGDINRPPRWLPWLSQHHQRLFQHFVESTVTMFTGNAVAQQEIRACIIPMAVDTNHGFSLIAGVLSLASTHRRNLGLHEHPTEADFWRDMSVGHLRRPTVHEDESTQDVFAGTALILAIRDVISDGANPSPWRVHLQGALSVLQRDASADTVARKPLQEMARSLQLRSLVPIRSNTLDAYNSGAMQDEARLDAVGFPYVISGVLQQIGALKLEKDALRNIQSSSGDENMQRLWGSLRGQCLELIVQLRTLSESPGGPHSNWHTSNRRLHGHVALLLVYSGLLDLTTNDTGMRSALGTAMNTLRALDVGAGNRIDPDLVFSLFIIGCLVRSTEDRALVHSSLTRIAAEYGKGNASRARTFLGELWAKVDAQNRLVEQSDVDELMAEKNWDLSLW